MLKAIPQHIHSRMQRFMDKRIPQARSVTLDQQRIFIFPTKNGLVFLLTLLLILLVAINYQTNMVFALCCLLLSLFVVAILHTYANFAGLSVAAAGAIPCFAWESASFTLLVSRQDDKPRYDIELSWPDSERLNVSLLEDNHEQRLSLHLPALKRGLLRPPRLLVESRYPLGLLRCWTWLALDVQATVYPKPLSCPWAGSDVGDAEEGELLQSRGSEDFYGLKAYQPGDSLKHIAWKSFAKGQSLQSKEFASYRQQQRYLDWQAFTGDRETRLSKLCYWTLQLDQQGIEYGLCLPGVDISPAAGELHRERVLSALALFELGPGDSQ